MKKYKKKNTTNKSKVINKCIIESKYAITYSIT